jgi:cytochrome P450
MSGPTDIDVQDLVDPKRYAERGYPHDVWTRLRAEDPVAWFEPENLEPFWAITKHADICEIARQPTIFSSAQGITLIPKGAVIPPSEILVMLDPPKHGQVRRVANRRFTPRAMNERRDHIERISSQILDDALGSSGELDFIEQISAPFPLAVIAWILGVPSDDWTLLFDWSNAVIGKEDPEYRLPGETAGQTAKRARGALRGYLQGLLDERRRDPQDDFMSELLEGEIEGQPLTDDQLVSYCELLVEAGNETTRNAVSGGLVAFAEHRDQWDALKERPELLPDAVEEILRWVSPITHFIRIATEDYELRGKTIRKGDQVALYFASANRDEEVFDDPFTFRIDRHPNHHIAFGFGAHFCMGAHVARVELETIYRHLLERLESFEVTGAIERLSSITNGSIKHLPLSYRTTNGDT